MLLVGKKTDGQTQFRVVDASYTFVINRANVLVAIVDESDAGVSFLTPVDSDFISKASTLRALHKLDCLLPKEVKVVQ